MTSPPSPSRALRDRNAGVDWQRLDDVVYGCANQAGEDNRNVGRMALLLAGLPQEVPGSTVNRLCGSSMDAVAIAARAIAAGEMELVDCRRRREHVARAVRDEQGETRRSPAASPSRTPRSAGGSSIRRWSRPTARIRWPRPRRTWRRNGRCRAAIRTPSPLRSQQRAGAAIAAGRLRRRDRAGHRAAAQGPRHRFRRRAPAAGYHARGAVPAETHRPAGRHRHRRKRLGHQRRRLRDAARIRGGRAEPSA